MSPVGGLLWPRTLGWPLSSVHAASFEHSHTDKFEARSSALCVHVSSLSSLFFFCPVSFCSPLVCPTLFPSLEASTNPVPTEASRFSLHYAGCHVGALFHNGRVWYARQRTPSLPYPPFSISPKPSLPTPSLCPPILSLHPLIPTSLSPTFPS